MEIENQVEIKQQSSTSTEEIVNLQIEKEVEARLGFCEVCAVNEAKYTCPRCEVKSCSLKCSTIHKKELECDGSRDRTRFIPLNKFSNIDLSSDYRLIEDITRSVEAMKKTRRKFNKCDYPLPYHLVKLAGSSMTRKTKLQFLPYTFNRRERNTTKLNFHKDIIFWHVEWIFKNADNLRLHDEQVRETEKLCSVLHKYLVKQEDAGLQEQLKFYQAADLPGIRLFLRAECKPGRKYYELDPTLTLQESFSGKNIIEYPIIEVVLKYHVVDMDIIDSDDEDATETKSNIGESVINNIIKHSESNDSINKALKNLLFISEHSDGEISD